ncbi:MAG: diguanylate cyclase [Candidatus Sabulitectum sp.]|nr:diguanylate cyclase [Candidatus Sabulitectum sp.]
MTSMNKLDDLTGLHTRGILDDLDREFSAEEGRDIWSMMIIDIDHFKLVNDVYGHLQGDMVIRRIANILSRNCRGADTLLRYGGDEFVIVMPHTEQLKAVNQAERILQGLAREVFSQGMDVGLSIGVAESKPEDLYLADILKRADGALYEAKSGGRGKVSFHKDKNTKKESAEISFEHFVGRQADLSTLRNALNETITGKGRFALISGEPGIGKRRLISELKHYSRFKDCLFLQSSCDELGADKPYQQITSPIAEKLLTFSKDDLESLAKVLPKILPQTAELFPDLKLKLAKAPSTDEEGVVRLRIYLEISSILRWIASRQPILFVVDSIHWISDNNFDLLSYLIRATENVPIIFIATINESQEDPSGIRKKIRILSSLVRFTSINLGRLDEEYTKHMVMFALRDPKIPGDVLQMLVKQSGGNPLYLKELLLSLLNSGAIEPAAEGGWIYKITSDLPLPATISQLMSGRLDRLDPFTRDVLSAGSLMPGGSFSLAPLSAILHRDELEIAKALEGPLKLKLIFEHLSQFKILEYHFIHDAMRTFLLHDLSQGTRKALQSRFGLYYEEIYNHGNTAIVPLAAHHYCDSLDPVKAMRFALLAEKQADNRDAKRDALRWLEQYMAFSVGVEENRQEAFYARLELGKLHTLFAEHSKATGILKDAVAFATTVDQTALLRFQEAHLHFNMGDYGTADSLYKTTIALLPPGKERILAKLQIAFIQYLTVSEEKGFQGLNGIKEEIQSIKNVRERKHLLATYYMRHGTIALNIFSRVDSTEECLKAVTIYRQLGDKTGEARALLNTAASLFATSKYEVRINILNDALKVLTETGDTHAIMGAYINLGQAHYSAMDFDLARDYFQRCLDLVEATGTKRFGIWANSYLANLDTRDENYSSAEMGYKKAIESADELGLAPMALNARMNLVTMLINKKDFKEADIHLTQLETEETMKTMDGATRKVLLGYRGTERLNNPSLERTSALKEAEQNLRNATSDTEEEPSIREIDLLGTLVECLQEQNKMTEAGEALTRAQNMFSVFVSAIGSDHYRQKILESTTAKKLAKLKKQLERE